jgi:PAS domain S-box-containing protein
MLGANDVEVAELKAQLLEARERERHHLEAIAKAHERERGMRELTRTLGEVSQRDTLEKRGIEPALAEILKVAALHLGVARASVWKFDGPNRLALVSLVGEQSGEAAAISEADCPSYFRALASERVIAAHDVYTDHRTHELRAYFESRGIVSLLDAPVRVFGRSIGVVCHEHIGIPRKWLPEEESFAATIGDFVALALEAQAHHKADSIARAAHLRFKHLVESLPCVVYSFSPSEPGINYVSPQAITLTGLTSDAWLGTEGVARWIDLVHPEDREWIAARIQKGIGPGVPSSVEYRLRLPDGRVRWVTDTCSFVRAADGSPLLLQGTLVDITDLSLARREREEHKQRFRKLLEEAAFVAVLLDQTGRVTFVNDYCLRLTGRTRAEVLGRNWFELALPAAARDRAREVFLNVMQQGTIAPRREDAITTVDGEARLIVWSDTILHDSDGRRVGMASLGCDVTERTEVERQAWRSQKNESLGRMAAGIAHDFNNVLSVIVGSADLLRRERTLSRSALESLELVDEASKRAAELTRSLLLYAREEGGHTSTFELDPLLEASVPLLQAAAGASVGVRLALAASGVQVTLDATHLRQILLNLIVNARDAMPDGGVIRITSEEAFVGDLVGLDMVPGRYVIVRVTDTGSGVPEALIERIFDPFFTTKTAAGGSGLGLATCAGIARRAGGRVCASNEPGGGACFTLYLPLAASKSHFAA